jgi:hypothetical protein
LRGTGETTEQRADTGGACLRVLMASWLIGQARLPSPCSMPDSNPAATAAAAALASACIPVVQSVAPTMCAFVCGSIEQVFTCK